MFQNILAFAKLHDWGSNATVNEHGVRVQVSYTQKINGKVWLGTESAAFKSMKQLKEWAGY